MRRLNFSICASLRGGRLASLAKHTSIADLPPVKGKVYFYNLDKFPTKIALKDSNSFRVLLQQAVILVYYSNGLEGSPPPFEHSRIVIKG